MRKRIQSLPVLRTKSIQIESKRIKLNEVSEKTKDIHISLPKVAYDYDQTKCKQLKRSKQLLNKSSQKYFNCQSANDLRTPSTGKSTYLSPKKVNYIEIQAVEKRSKSCLKEKKPIYELSSGLKNPFRPPLFTSLSKRMSYLRSERHFLNFPKLYKMTRKLPSIPKVESRLDLSIFSWQTKK